MTEHKPQATLVSKLILVVLSLIFCCLLFLVYKSYQTPLPGERQPVTAVEAVPTPEPAAPVSVTPPTASRPIPPPLAPPHPTLATNPLPSAGQGDPARPSTAPPTAAVSRPAPTATTATVQPATGVAAATIPGAVLRYQALPTGSEMKLEGDSTAHKWTCIAKIITGSFEVEPAWQTDLTLQSATCLGPDAAPPRCEVKVPVRALKSQVAVGASIMDNRMQAEMDLRSHPWITYTLTRVAMRTNAPASGSPVTFDTTGLLVVRGQTNQVSFPVTMERMSGDRLKFVGAYDTTMSALGVKPPEFTVMGVGMKCHDPIRLTWTWLVGLVADSAAK